MKKILKSLMVVLLFFGPTLSISAKDYSTTDKSVEEIKEMVSDVYDEWLEEETDLSSLEEEMLNIFDATMGEFFVAQIMRADGFSQDGKEIKWFIVTPYIPEFNLILLGAEMGEERAINAWNETIVKNFNEMSLIFDEVNEDTEYIVMMSNPSNVENYIYLSYKGNTYYDYVIGLDMEEELIENVLTK